LPIQTDEKFPYKVAIWDHPMKLKLFPNKGLGWDNLLSRNTTFIPNSTNKFCKSWRNWDTPYRYTPPLFKCCNLKLTNENVIKEYDPGLCDRNLEKVLNIA
jgi:hypothetical protein